MGLRDLFARLRADATSARHQGSFTVARHREAALAGHEDLGSVLRTLEGTKAETYLVRESLIAALLREHCRRRNGPWVLVLLLAFSPMLNRLRTRIRTEKMSGGDIDQMIVEGFLGAVEIQCAANVSRNLAAYLRARTQTFVFGRLAAEQRLQVRQRELERLIQGDEVSVFHWAPSASELGDGEAMELAELLMSLAGDVLARRKLEAVVATRLRGQSLREYIAESCVPQIDATETLASVLQRVKREHSRTLNQLRPILERSLAQAKAHQASEKLGLTWTN